MYYESRIMVNSMLWLWGFTWIYLPVVSNWSFWWYWFGLNPLIYQVPRMKIKRKLESNRCRRDFPFFSSVVNRNLSNIFLLWSVTTFEHLSEKEIDCRWYMIYQRIKAYAFSPNSSLIGCKYYFSSIAKYYC